MLRAILGTLRKLLPGDDGRRTFNFQVPDPVRTVNMDEGAWIDFTAAGRTFRADPFDLLARLVEIDEAHGYRPGMPMPAGLLDDVALFAAKFLRVESVSRAQAMRFYAAVTSAVDDLTADLKKKLGTKAESRIGSE